MDLQRLTWTGVDPPISPRRPARFNQDCFDLGLIILSKKLCLEARSSETCLAWTFLHSTCSAKSGCGNDRFHDACSSRPEHALKWKAIITQIRTASSGLFGSLLLFGNRAVEVEKML